MKRILGLILSIASLGAFAGSSQASVKALKNSMESPADAPQVRIQIGGDRHRRYRDDDYRQVRTFRQTRIVRYGRGLYRETYLVRYFPSGRTDTVLIDRDRIG